MAQLKSDILGIKGLDPEHIERIKRCVSDIKGNNIVAILSGSDQFGRSGSPAMSQPGVLIPAITSLFASEVMTAVEIGKGMYIGGGRNITLLERIRAIRSVIPYLEIANAYPYNLLLSLSYDTGISDGDQTKKRYIFGMLAENIAKSGCNENERTELKGLIKATLFDLMSLHNSTEIAVEKTLSGRSVIISLVSENELQTWIDNILLEQNGIEILLEQLVEYSHNLFKTNDKALSVKTLFSKLEKQSLAFKEAQQQKAQEQKKAQERRGRESSDDKKIGGEKAAKKKKAKTGDIAAKILPRKIGGGGKARWVSRTGGAKVRPAAVASPPKQKKNPVVPRAALAVTSANGTVSPKKKAVSAVAAANGAVKPKKKAAPAVASSLKRPPGHVRKVIRRKKKTSKGGVNR